MVGDIRRWNFRGVGGCVKISLALTHKNKKFQIQSILKLPQTRIEKTNDEFE